MRLMSGNVPELAGRNSINGFCFSPRDSLKQYRNIAPFTCSRLQSNDPVMTQHTYARVCERARARMCFYCKCEARALTHCAIITSAFGPARTRALTRKHGEQMREGTRVKSVFGIRFPVHIVLHTHTRAHMLGA